MPAMEAKESCRPTLAAASGLYSRISDRAAESEVIGSFSRFTRGAISSSVCITPARTADGFAPVTSTKVQIRPRAKRELSRPRPRSIWRKPTRKAMCIPETATTCISPARLMASSCSVS